MEEIWKVWKDTTIDSLGRHNKNGGLYEVSNFGRCRKNGVIVEFDDTQNGYFYFCGKLVHRLVASLFIPNPDNKQYVDHIDCNAHNNNVENLRWCTPSENNLNPITRKRRYNAQHNEEYHNKLLKRLEYFYWNTDNGINKRKASSKRMTHYNTGREPWNKNIV